MARRLPGDKRGAKRGDRAGEVREAMEVATEQGLAAKGEPGYQDLQRAKRVEALSLRLAGATFQTIAKQLKIGPQTASNMVKTALGEIEHPRIEDLRDLENARLDRAQMALWNGVLAGDLPSVDRFLKISERRSKLNGLDAPTKVDLSISVRQEMEEALQILEATILETPTVREIEAPFTQEQLNEIVEGEDEDDDDLY